MYKFEDEIFRKVLEEKKGRETTSYFASQMGVSASNLSRAENNRTVTIQTLVSICNYLDIDPRKFIVKKN